MRLKKGPWTDEEDKILISYINLHNGHGNWRALPKRAGLLRCGKSCRLRWMNYLRPDIKRGNFTTEEEETIIKLHAHLGNKWSVIAARLPGRTDNEIKNIWHTHLKKRLIIKPKSPVPIIEKVEPHACYSDCDQKLENYSFADEFSVGENLREMGDSFWSEVFWRDDIRGGGGGGGGGSDSEFGNSVASEFNMKVSVDLWHNNLFWDLPQF